MRYSKFEVQVKELGSHLKIVRKNDELHIRNRRREGRLMSVSTEYVSSLSTMWDYDEDYDEFFKRDEILRLAMELANTPLDERGDINEIGLLETW